MPGNGKLCKFTDICMEKLVKSHQVNLFLFVADFSYLEPLCASAYFAMVRLLQDCAIVGKPMNWSGSTLIQTLENVPLLFMLKTKKAIYSKQKYVCIMLQATHIRAATEGKAAKAWSLAGF